MLAPFLHAAASAAAVAATAAAAATSTAAAAAHRPPEKFSHSTAQHGHGMGVGAAPACMHYRGRPTQNDSFDDSRFPKSPCKLAPACVQGGGAPQLCMQCSRAVSSLVCSLAPRALCKEQQSYRRSLCCLDSWGSETITFQDTPLHK